MSRLHAADQYRDAFGNIVGQGDTVVWSPSGVNGLSLRKIVRVHWEGARAIVVACHPGQEDVPSSHRRIPAYRTALYPPHLINPGA